MTRTEEQITRLLKAWQDGDGQAQDEVFRLIYKDLRRIAQNRLSGEGRQHTLQATELVHEVFPQLARQRQPWQNRSQFFAIASECMRRFLVDYARTQKRQKRGGGTFRVSFSDINPTEICRIENFDEILAIDRALEKLNALDPVQCEIIKHRYFGGLAREEIADLLQVSPSTIDRSYRLAKAWLKRELVFQFSPYLLRVSEIRRPVVFIEQFFAASPNPFARHLRPALPVSLLERIEYLNTGETISFDLLPELLENLNKLLLGNAIFPAVLSAKLEQNQMPKGSLTAEDNLRSNRRLFDKAFSQEFTDGF